jgi:hypothetical protein
MDDQDREYGRERRPDRGEPLGRAVAPPIEREHETQAGVFEEDERRERGQAGAAEPDEAGHRERERR